MLRAKTMKARTEVEEGKTLVPTSWPEGSYVRKLPRLGLRSEMTSEQKKDRPVFR